MRLKLTSAAIPGWFAVALSLLLLAGGHAYAQASDLKLEVQLIWGTNDKQSPDPKHKPVAPEVLNKLKELPLKWASYFEVKRISFTVPKGGMTSVALSEKCKLDVRSLGKSKIEVTHFGKGQEVWKGTQALPKGETLVLGGNAPNATSWLVVLKRVE